MDDINEFFSPEALRLLEESGIDCGTVFQADEVPVEHKPFTAPAPSGIQMSQIGSQCLYQIPGCSTLSFGSSVKPKRKRAKFDIKAREKVATVRKKGACLRCRALKIPVCFPASYLLFTDT